MEAGTGTKTNTAGLDGDKNKHCWAGRGQKQTMLDWTGTKTNTAGLDRDKTNTAGLDGDKNKHCWAGIQSRCFGLCYVGELAQGQITSYNWRRSSNTGVKRGRGQMGRRAERRRGGAGNGTELGTFTLGRYCLDCRWLFDPATASVQCKLTTSRVDELRLPFTLWHNSTTKNAQT